MVVLAFYPADFTKGCTAEMQTFTERYDELFGDDVVVAAISYRQRGQRTCGLPRASAFPSSS